MGKSIANRITQIFESEDSVSDVLSRRGLLIWMVIGLNVRRVNMPIAHLVGTWRRGVRLESHVGIFLTSTSKGDVCRAREPDVPSSHVTATCRKSPSLIGWVPCASSTFCYLKSGSDLFCGRAVFKSQPSFARINGVGSKFLSLSFSLFESFFFFIKMQLIWGRHLTWPWPWRLSSLPSASNKTPAVIRCTASHWPEVTVDVTVCEERGTSPTPSFHTRVCVCVCTCWLKNCIWMLPHYVKKKKKAKRPQEPVFN